MIDFGIITLFPEMFSALELGITGQAIAHELIRIKTWNPRTYTHNKHRTVDDRPYGGGPGMVMQAQPLCDAIHVAKADFPPQKLFMFHRKESHLINRLHKNARLALQ